MQVKALKFLKEEAITAPEWLFNKDLLKKTFPVKESPMGPFEYAPYNLKREFQYGFLYSLVSQERLLRMMEMEVMLGKENVFTVAELLKELRATAFAKTLSGKALSVEDRMLEQNYVDVLLVSTDKMLEKINKTALKENTFKLKNELQICDFGDNAKAAAGADHTSLRNIQFSSMSRTSDVAAAKRGELLQIVTLLEKNKGRGDDATKGHYMDLILRIRQSLKMN